MVILLLFKRSFSKMEVLMILAAQPESCKAVIGIKIFLLFEDEIEMFINGKVCGEVGEDMLILSSSGERFEFGEDGVGHTPVSSFFGEVFRPL